MKYEKTIVLKDGRACILRNAVPADAAAVIADMEKVHLETDFLMAYPGERKRNVQDERAFLQQKLESESEIQLCAVVDGQLIGLAAIAAVVLREKTRHRAEFSISIEREFWNLGIGRALTEACIECAAEAGYSQLELEVVSENKSAVKLYQGVGFTEYGRNPRGFWSRYSGWQELILMRLEINRKGNSEA